MTAPQPKDDAVLQRHMVRGSAWIIGVRWSLRVLGLITTIILARLLTPADYGIVAIASMIVGMVEVFSRTGQMSAIVRHPNPTREHYDSAWTVSLLLGIGLGGIIWILTPLTTAYFHEPRATLIVEILAFRTMLSGAQNIGIVNFQRYLQFNKQFWFSVIPTLVSFPLTIASAFILRNYWALVIGLMSEYVTTFTLSYMMEPFRPRISFSKVREIWSFSFWSLVKNIGIYLNMLVDRVAIGGFAGSSAMGRYQVAAEVATTPSQEIVNPIVSVLFPVLASVQHDREKRVKLYLTVLYWSALICTSTAVGVALVTDDFVDLVLGSQWQDVKPLMPWMALSFGVLGMSNSVYTAFDTIGMPLMSARMQWLRVFGLAIAIIPVAYMTHDLVAVAMTRLIVTIVITPTLFFALSRVFGFTARDIGVTIWRPMVAGLTMSAVVLSANTMIPFTGPLRLVIDVALGAVSYTATIMALWNLVGRPQGPERAFMNRVSSSLALLGRSA
jgi:O-antigen/teichoic acid export membrane protein